MQHIELLVDLVLVPVEDALALHGIFEGAVGLVVGLVDATGYPKQMRRKEPEKINDEGSLALVLLEHGEHEVSNPLRVRHLEGRRLLVEYLVHDPSEVLVSERRLQCRHVIHQYSQAEDVRAVVIRLLPDDLRAEVERRSDVF